MPSDTTAKSLISQLRALFSQFGIPAELSTDGGPPFTSYAVATFLRDWDVRLRLSSAYFPQSNGRAELAVKVAKRMIEGNAGPNGRLNTDRFMAALLQHRNTPLKDIGLSPAQLLYGRPMRDALPLTEQALGVHPEWQQMAEDRENALAKRHVKTVERFNQVTRTLPALEVGEKVIVQNQTGNHPTRWDKTGTVVQVHSNRQYSVKMDGSGRHTLRNRRFLRRILPVLADTPMQLNVPVSSEENPLPDVLPENPTESQVTESPVIPDERQFDMVPSPNRLSEPTPPPRRHPTDDTALRRGTRPRRRPRELSPSWRGQYHDFRT